MVMSSVLDQDRAEMAHIMRRTADISAELLANINERPVAVVPTHNNRLLTLPESGLGAEGALQTFMARWGDGMSGSAGSRYFGFVTGGTTPAALAGDWLTSAFDNNGTGFIDSVVPFVELETLAMLRELFGLSADFEGSFVSGATMSNFVGLAIGRQWAGHQHGVNVARDGLYGLPRIPVLSATAHASCYKALAMLGMGRDIRKIATLPQREALDIDDLTRQLEALNGQPCMVIANAGTVNTVDYDDFVALGRLKQSHNVWIHLDGAFGAFAAVSPQFKHLVVGMDVADSICIDAHKYLNVPYDSAMQFTRHGDLQVEVFQNSAVYLGAVGDEPNFIHRTPENSRRFRALAAWMSLVAYGQTGYREIVERTSGLAAQLGAWIDAADDFRLLAPVQLNGVCFTLATQVPSMDMINDYLDRIRADGRLFLTPTSFHGTPAVRVSITNWRTQLTDIEQAWQALHDCLPI